MLFRRDFSVINANLKLISASNVLGDTVLVCWLPSGTCPPNISMYSNTGKVLLEGDSRPLFECSNALVFLLQQLSKPGWTSVRCGYPIFVASGTIFGSIKQSVCSLMVASPASCFQFTTSGRAFRAWVVGAPIGILTHTTGNIWIDRRRIHQTQNLKNEAFWIHSKRVHL